MRVGGFVRAGDQVGSVVPEGKLHVVANFAPPAALGRILPGQTARLRLEGFPWGQYGSVGATVTSVASEIRDGTIRVELALKADDRSRIPLQHGLPGSVEVQVEDISPASLVLRIAAQPQASTAETRWSVQAARSPPDPMWSAWGAPLFDAHLVRNRHGPVGQWIMEWNCDECLFSEPAPYPQPVAAAPADRSHPKAVVRLQRRAG